MSHNPVTIIGGSLPVVDAITSVARVALIAAVSSVALVAVISNVVSASTFISGGAAPGGQVPTMHTVRLGSGNANSIAFTSLSTTQSAALSGSFFRVVADAACFIQAATSASISSITGEFYLPANIPMIATITSGQQIAARGATVAGRLYFSAVQP